MEPKRIAVLISGRVKTFEETWVPLNENIFKRNHVDIFLSHNSLIPDNLENFCKMYPVKVMESMLPPLPEKWNKYRRNEASSVFRAGSMFFNIENAYHLMNNFCDKYSVKFDIVLYIRVDMIINTPLNFPENIKNNSIYIPNGADWGGLNDQMAYGNMESMKKYCSVFTNISTYCEEENIIFHPETLLLHHVGKQKLNIERFHFPYQLHDGRKV